MGNNNLRIDKIINADSLKPNDIVVLKMPLDFNAFETLKLITKPLNEKLKNLVLCLRQDMDLSIVEEEFMNSKGWYRKDSIKQLGDKK